MSARQKRVTRQIRAALEAAKVGVESTNGLVSGKWPQRRPLTPLEHAVARAFGDMALESIVARLDNLSDLDKAQLAFELLMLITKPKDQEVGVEYSLKYTKKHIQVLINRLM